MARPHRAIDARTNLAQIAEEQGNKIQALSLAEPVITHLQTKGIDGVVRPFRAYLVVYRILQASGDGRATAFLQEACTRLHALAEQISSPALRHSFLENVPLHVELRRLNAQSGNATENR
jgi:hypothetical protein